jgi:carbonic anhydrase
VVFDETKSIIDDRLKANKGYAEAFKLGALPRPPARKLAILVCMDARLTIEPMLGLYAGDALVIRNAGGIATEDAIRSLIISHTLLGTQEFMIINPTDCGMLTFKNDDLKTRLKQETRVTAASPETFHAFSDSKENKREQIQKIKSHPCISKGIPVRGFIYDVTSGQLNEVE